MNPHVLAPSVRPSHAGSNSISISISISICSNPTGEAVLRWAAPALQRTAEGPSIQRSPTSV
jgi:hypothetical protein